MPYGSKVPTEGIIRLSQLQEEFGGGPPTALSEYYKAISGTTYDEQFATVGTNYFTVPTGVTQVTFYGYGGGGCGGGNSPAGGSETGQGGGGGAYVQKTFSVTPGETLTVVVGAGGGPWVSGSLKGGDGGNTYVSQGGSPVCTAGGGQGGSRNVGQSGDYGAGGVATGGDINYSGGKGQRGDEFSYTGWGANAAGPSGDGASGAQRQSGVLPEAGSGSGGNINHPRNNANGNPPPTVPGGGGGGGNGGASGAAGLARIRYTATSTPANKYVTNLTENASIPSSGQISLSNYYGSARVIQPPVVNEYTVPGTFTYEAPTNTTSITVTAVGGGGNGSYWGNNYTDTNAGGGGGGGFIGTISASAGEIWTLVVGQGGPSGSSNSGGGDPGPASAGQATTLTSGTKSITSGGGGGGRAYVPSQTYGGAGGVVSYSGAFTSVTSQNGNTGGTANKGSNSQGGLAGLDGYGPAINLYRGTNTYGLVGPAYAGRGVSSREYYEGLGQVGRNGYIKIVAHGTLTYSAQGTYTWTVPTGITSVTVSLKGAGGAGGTGDGNGQAVGGNAGSTLTGTLGVAAGDVLTFYVGGKGSWYSVPNGRGPGNGSGGGGTGGVGNAGLYGGGNGGAPGPNGSSGTGGGGGAASALKRNATTIAVAGGGGGGGAAGSQGNALGSEGVGGNTGSTFGASAPNYPDNAGGGDGPGGGGGGGGYEGGTGGRNQANAGRDLGAYSGNNGTNLVPANWVVSSANNGGSIAGDGQDGGITISW